MGQYSYDVEAGDFQRIVIEGSSQVPVVVDFWAEWCGPCRMLKPILEKLAEEYQGKFILAKVESDRNQAVAAQYGVRGIPNVKAFRDGKIVDEFSGAIPESAVREFLERLIPSPSEELRLAAARLHVQGDLAQALKLLGDATKLDARNTDVHLDATAIMLELDQVDEARRLFDSLPLACRQAARGQQIEARLIFAEAGSGDEAALREHLTAQPDDLDARLRLANLLIAADRHREGLEELLDMVRRDRTWNEGAARKAMLAVFSLLGSDAPLVGEYRRKLASALN